MIISEPHYCQKVKKGNYERTTDIAKIIIFQGQSSFEFKVLYHILYLYTNNKDTSVQSEAFWSCGVSRNVSGALVFVILPAHRKTYRILKCFKKSGKKSLARWHNINMFHKISYQNSKYCMRYKNENRDINVKMGQI